MSYFPLGAGSGGVWTAIQTVTVTGQASIEMYLTGTYKMYRLHIDNLVSVADDAQLWMRFSTDAGVTFLSGASDYAWNVQGGTQTATTFEGDVADAKLILGRSIAPALMGTGTAESFNSIINIHNANQTTKAVCVSDDMVMLDSDSLIVGLGVRGGLIANIDEVDAIQIRTDTGNLSTGRITLYGLGLS